MNWSNRLVPAVSALALAFGWCGCAPSAGPSWGVRSDIVSLHEEGKVYSYSTVCLTRNGRVYLLLAAPGGTGGSEKGGEGKFQGELYAKDGVKIGWTYTTQDGQSGKVAIDSEEFDLTAGALFLVSTKEKPAHVQQLAIEPVQLQTCSDAKKLLGVMKGNPQMATFLELCKGSE